MWHFIFSDAVTFTFTFTAFWQIAWLAGSARGFVVFVVMDFTSVKWLKGVKFMKERLDFENSRSLVMANSRASKTQIPFHDDRDAGD